MSVNKNLNQYLLLLIISFNGCYKEKSIKEINSKTFKTEISTLSLTQNDSESPIIKTFIEDSKSFLNEEEVEKKLKERNQKNCLLHNIKLPDNITKALKEWNKEFEIWESTDYTLEVCLNIDYVGSYFSLSDKNSLSKAVGDFNGDGRDDAVVVGHIKDNEIVVVALSNNNENYNVSVVCADRTEGFSFLTYNNNNECIYNEKQPENSIWTLISNFPSPWEPLAKGLTGLTKKDFPYDKGNTPLLLITKVVQKGTKVEGCKSDNNCGSYILNADGFIISRRYLIYILKGHYTSITPGLLYIFNKRDSLFNTIYINAGTNI